MFSRSGVAQRRNSAAVRGRHAHPVTFAYAPASSTTTADDLRDAQGRSPETRHLSGRQGPRSYPKSEAPGENSTSGGSPTTSKGKHKHRRTHTRRVVTESITPTRRHASSLLVLVRTNKHSELEPRGLHRYDMGNCRKTARDGDTSSLVRLTLAETDENELPATDAQQRRFVGSFVGSLVPTSYTRRRSRSGMLPSSSHTPKQLAAAEANEPLLFSPEERRASGQAAKQPNCTNVPRARRTKKSSRRETSFLPLPARQR